MKEADEKLKEMHMGRIHPYVVASDEAELQQCGFCNHQ